MEELISIIVPVYNVEKYLNKCIDSIINQTYKNLEIILVDDGSLDNSGKICNEYAEKDSRIKVIHKENGGVSSARNKGLEIANGEWVAFVDSDDWIENNFCEVLLNNAIEYKVDIVLCGYNRVSLSNIDKIRNTKKIIELNANEYLINVLNPQTGFGFCHMKLYKRKNIRNIKFKEGLLVGEDALFNEQVSKKIKKAIFVEESLYNYRINNNSVVRKFDKNYSNKYLKSIKINKEYIFENYKSNKEVIQNYYNFVAYHVLLIAVNYCYNKENKEKNKMNLLKKVLNIPEFKAGIKKSNYENLSITRKITLFTIKHRLYFFTEIICKYRQKQNKVGENK